MKGKVSYMSPEQVRMEQIDNRSDIFAVGIVLHEMLTGRRLFKSANEFTGAKQVLEAVVPLPSSLNPEVPASVDTIVMRALERKLGGPLSDRGRDGGGSREGAVRDAGLAARAAQADALAVPPGPVAHGRGPAPVHAVAGLGNRRAMAAPSRAAERASSSKVTRPIPEGPLEIDLGDLAASGPVVASRRRRGRRRWLALGALGGAVVALVLLAQSPRKGRSRTVTVAPAGAQSVPAPAPASLNRRHRPRLPPSRRSWRSHSIRAHRTRR